MKYRWTAWTVLLAFFLLCACGKTDSAALRPTGASVVAESDGENAYPLLLTDQTGRAVTLPRKPERIVSGYYITTSTLIALGAEDRIVGIEEKAGKRNIYRLSAPALPDLPEVGSARNPNPEAVAALMPDLVLLPAQCRAAADSLTGLGIPVLLVNPESGEAAEEMIALLGKAVSEEKRAQELLSYIRGVREKLRACPGETVRVYMAGNSGFLRTSGQKMYQAEMIRESGNENVAESLTDPYWADVSYEQVLLWDPELILLAADASCSVEEVLRDPMLSGVSAVEKGQVYAMPSHIEAWDSPVPGSVLGSLYLSALTGGVAKEEAEAITKEFYETFYGFTP